MTSDSPTLETGFSAPQQQLLRAAERLFALRGIDSVSTREIAREAGQKNHSAVRYHFGAIDAVLEAILEFRMRPLNERRHEMLTRIESEGQISDVRALVFVLVDPFSAHLLASPEESYYVSLLSQLYSRQQADAVFGAGDARTSAIRALGEHVIDALGSMPRRVVEARLRWVGVQVVHTVAEWDHQRRTGEIEFAKAHLSWCTSNLVDYLVGGLCAPVSSDLRIAR